MGHRTNGYILVAIWVMDPDPYRDTGKTCLGGGMHCPSASLYFTVVLSTHCFVCVLFMNVASTNQNTHARVSLL